MVSKLTLDDFANARYVIDKVGKDKAHFMGIPDPFRTSWVRRGGMQNLLMDFKLNPQLVHDLARIATDFAKATIDLAIQKGTVVHALNEGQSYRLKKGDLQWHKQGSIASSAWPSANGHQVESG